MDTCRSDSVAGRAVLVCLVVAAGCRPARPPHSTSTLTAGEKPNVVFIVIDTARASHFSYAGWPRRTTPMIDAFAADCVVYGNAHSVAPWTLPAHMSMFTGLLPGRHGATWASFSEPADMTLPEMMSRSFTPKQPERLLAKRLKQAGYATMAFSANPWVSQRTGFGEGFDHFVDAWRAWPRFRKAYGSLPDEFKVSPQVDRGPAGRSLVMFKHYLATNRVTEPFFVFFNFVDPHFPYSPPGRFILKFGGDRRVIPEMFDGQPGRVELALIAGGRTIDFASLQRFYDAELYYVDTVVGELLEWLRRKGFYDRSLIVLTSDHGEHLGENGRFSHQLSVEEELLRIPLLIKYPGGVGAGSEVTNHLVSNLDIYQTILAAAYGDAVPGTTPEGSQDLARMDRFARKVLIAEDYYSEAYLRQLQAASPSFDLVRNRVVRRAAYTRGWKYVFRGEEMVAAAPTGHRSPPEDESRERADILRRVRAYARGVESDGLRHSYAAEPDPELLKKLESLGYLRSADQDE